MNQNIKIGVISDTHGMLRPEVLSALQGVTMIIHAGDIGAPEILHKLGTVAPVVAVRGNNDQGAWAHELPMTEVVEIGRISIYVLHDAGLLDLNPSAAGFSAVICGHSHRPLKESRNGVFFLNPGSAGPRRLRLPASVAILSIEETRLNASLIALGD